MINLGKYDVCFVTMEKSCNIPLRQEWKEHTIYQRKNRTYFIKHNGKRTTVFISDDKRTYTYIERI